MMHILAETPMQKAERLVREAVARVAREHSPAAYDWLDVVKLNLAVFHANHADFKTHYQRLVSDVRARAFSWDRLQRPNDSTTFGEA